MAGEPSMGEKTNFNRKEMLQDDDLEAVSGGKYTGPVFAYTIQEGDSLSVLAHRFGTTVRVLRELNNITDLSMISTGTIIMIPQRS